MTAKNIKKRSIEGDRYYTPPWLVRQCVSIVLPQVLPVPPRSILEPSAGGGAFTLSLRNAYPEALIHANDLDETVKTWKGADKSMHSDFLAWKKAPLNNGDFYDLCVGNPPFTLALAFVKTGLRVANVVTYILRQGFMSSAERCPILRDEIRPSNVHIIAHRPSFTADGNTDSADYAFITWFRIPPLIPTTTQLDWLPNVPLEERKVRAWFPDELAV